MLIHDYTKYIEELEQSLDEVCEAKKLCIRSRMSAQDIDRVWRELVRCEIVLLDTVFALRVYMARPKHERLRPIRL